MYILNGRGLSGTMVILTHVFTSQSYNILCRFSNKERKLTFFSEGEINGLKIQNLLIKSIEKDLYSLGHA